MDDGHEVLDHLLLRTHILSVRDDDLCTIALRQIVDEVEAEPHEPVLAGHDDGPHRAVDDAVNQPHELWSVHVHPATHLGDDGERIASCGGEVGHGPYLVLKIRFLGRRRYAAVDDAFLLRILML